MHSLGVHYEQLGLTDIFSNNNLLSVLLNLLLLIWHSSESK